MNAQHIDRKLGLQSPFLPPHAEKRGCRWPTRFSQRLRCAAAISTAAFAILTLRSAGAPSFEVVDCSVTPSGQGLSVSWESEFMVYVYDANHIGFRGDNGAAGNRPWQMNVAKGYINAFLRWQVLGESGLKKFFDGTAMPCVSAHYTFLQFSDLPRRVLDNFEQGGWQVNTRSGAVARGSGINNTAENDLWQLNSSAPHDTRGLRIRWSDDPVNSWVRWDIPNDNIFGVGPARDVTKFDVLSLRVAQNYTAALNTEGEDQDFLIGLVTGAGVLPSVVHISDYGRIPYPDPFVFAIAGFCDNGFVGPGDYTKTALTTIRIPLADFPGADLGDVRQVVMLFSVEGHETGSIIVDNLEFSK